MQRKTPHTHRMFNRAFALFAAALLTVGLVPPLSAAAQPQSETTPATAEAAAPAAADRPEAPAAPSDVQPETDGILITVDAPAACEERSTTPNAAARSDADPLSLLSAEEPGLPEALRSAGIAPEEVVGAFDGIAVISAQPTAGQTDAEAAQAACALPGVKSAQVNYVYSPVEPWEETSPAGALSGELAPLAAPCVNDPFAQEASPEVRPNQYWIYAANLPDAWRNGAESVLEPVTVAMLDSGIMTAHEDLTANVLHSLAWDSYYGTPLNTAILNGGDNGGHGTHASGIAAACTNNGIGGAGASYNARILPIKVFNNATPKAASSTKALVAAYDYIFKAVNEDGCNVRVVNMSLGSYSQAVNDKALHFAIATARNQYGIATVCAGGNGEGGAFTVPRTDPLYPADFEECIAVTALEPSGANVAGSDYNMSKDISAPGRSVWSTYAKQGPLGNMYTALSGTSVAAPIVSGTLALMFAAVPDASVEEACAALYATAAPIVDSENDRSNTSGSHGALDAAAALDYLQAHHGGTPTFPDVPQDSWYYGAVSHVARLGVMTGYSTSDAFGALDPMNRAHMAQVLYNYYGTGTEDAPPAWQQDVDQEQWYAEAVNWVVAQGLMNGYSGTNEFGPDDPLTREQLAVVLANATHAEIEKASSAAFDALPDSADTSSWAVSAMKWATSERVINGKEQPDGTRLLKPQETATRAELAMVLSNALNRGLL